MATRTIQVQHLGSDDVTDWYSDVIPQIGETVRLDACSGLNLTCSIDQHGKRYRVVNVMHCLWQEPLRAESIPTIVVTEIASEVVDAA
jgi:hypothetical protein